MGWAGQTAEATVRALSAKPLRATGLESAGQVGDDPQTMRQRSSHEHVEALELYIRQAQPIATASASLPAPCVCSPAAPQDPSPQVTGRIRATLRNHAKITRCSTLSQRLSWHPCHLVMLDSKAVALRLAAERVRMM
jgi:hypothetical protein